VARRQIEEGVVVVHEVVHGMSSFKAKGIVLNLDFEKALKQGILTFS
jgi:hypothetical protein